MNKPHTGKINCSKIDKAHLFDGKNGKMLDIAIWENRDGPDQYGNTHYITQSVSKEARERGERGAIIGNIKWQGRTADTPSKREERAIPAPERPSPAKATDMHGDDVPF